ncbi:DUF1302 family protein [Arhodomonas sp. AD133]|uniref:DUF1302 family protein n=1 Tax=Arhodomonas sp. AD133 TaxID=3415009 RepID=UPI003EBB83D5
MRQTMIPGRALAFVVLALVGEAAEALDWAGRLETSLLVDAETAFQTVGGDLQKSQLTLTPQARLDISPSTRITGIARLRFDGADELEPGRPSQATRAALSRRVFVKERAELELRELYLDAFVGDVFLRLGKQQTVWGQADGLKVLDVVNPQSYREFILADYDDSRIPLWTAKAELPVGDGLLQLLWIPDRTYHDVPDPGASYAFTTPRLVPESEPGTPVRLEAPDRPGRFFADSDAGVRYSVFAGGWDLTLNYLYHYDDTAVFGRRVTADGVVVTPEYGRTHTFGGTASTAFGSFTLRSELAYSSNRRFITKDPGDRDGIAASGELGYVLGLDWQAPGDTFVSGQVFQSRLTGTSRDLNRDAVDTSVTLLFEREFLHETVTASVLWIHGFHDGDGLVQPGIRYDVSSNLSVRFGADVFYGPEHGLYGEFDDTDRVTIGFEWGL